MAEPLARIEAGVVVECFVVHLESRTLAGNLTDIAHPEGPFSNTLDRGSDGQLADACIFEGIIGNLFRLVAKHHFVDIAHDKRIPVDGLYVVANGNLVEITF